MSIVIDLDHETKKRTNPSIDAITALTQDDILKVNQTIIERMESPVILIPPGRRSHYRRRRQTLRPMLTLQAHMCGYKGNRHIGLAACIEFIHTATLLHDDVVDESDLRRGAADANAVWGNKSSVLVGDFLFSRAFELMVEDGSLDALRILSQASSVIAEGEVLQLVTALTIQKQQKLTTWRVMRRRPQKLFSARQAKSAARSLRALGGRL